LYYIENIISFSIKCQVFDIKYVKIEKNYLNGESMKDAICKLLGISTASYYRWKEERPIIAFLERYFRDKDLEEFLTTGKMTKLEEREENYQDYLLIDYVRYNLKEKLDKLLLKPGISKWLENIIPKNIFLKILKELSEDPVIEVEKYRSKEYLIQKIESYEVASINNLNKKKLLGIIKNNLSNIECYVLIKYTEEFLGDK